VRGGGLLAAMLRARLFGRDGRRIRLRQAHQPASTTRIASRRDHHARMTTWRRRAWRATA